MVEITIDSLSATYDIRGDECVMLCPPHPLMGGSRFDIRLERIASELVKEGFSVLRFDYRQPFRSGVGEIEDARLCLSYLKDRHDFIAVVGYSFGAVVASNIADFCRAAAYISPLREINAIEFKDARVPKLFVVAIRDQFVSLDESLSIFDSASEPKKLVKLDTDHFYFGKFDVLARAVRDFILSL